MKITLQNNSFTSENKANSQDEKVVVANQNLQSANSSIINSVEDVLTLSATAIKAYFDSQAAAQNQAIQVKKISNSSFRTNSIGDPAVVELTGSSNKIFDSTNSDLLYAKGSSNQFDSSLGNDSILFVGNKNKIQGYDNSIQSAILGDSNQINITGSGDLSATLKGNTNKITGDTGEDLIILDGKRNTISSGAGDDSIVTYGNENLIKSGTGNDVVLATGNSFNITAGEGDDTITTNGSGKINGEDGNDVIEVKSNKNTVYGGKGDDIIRFYGLSNTLKGEEGNDTFQVKLTEGSVSVDGGKDSDSVELDFKRSEYAIINGTSDVTFYKLSDHTKKLKVSYTDIESFKFSDGETLSLAELKEVKGLSYQVNESKDKTSIKNLDAATNVLDLNVPISNIVSSTKTSTGVKIIYKNSQNIQRTLQAQNFTYLKVSENQYIDLKSAPNFEFVNINPNNYYVISNETSNGRYQSKFYDKTSEALLLTKDYTEKGSNFLFSDGTFLSATELLSSFSGKSVDVNTDSTLVTPTTPTTNTAILKFSSDKIYKIDKTAADTYKLYFKKSDSETGSITFQNISFLTTEEGDELSFSSIYNSSSKIRSNEKSHSVYASDSQNTEFKRIAYNLTGNISYLESLIDGGYENLSTSQKSILQANAAILENSLTFASDYTDKTIDAATKKIYSLRVANLLRSRSDVLENLTDSGLDVYFTKDEDLGGTSSAFTTGYASYTGSGSNSKYEAHFVLSAFYGGIFDGNDGDAVDIHETLHILDFRSDKPDDGLPYEMSDSSATKYKTSRDALFATYNQTKQAVGAIRKYGFTNNQEFLAVSSENFYERPTDLNSTSSNLYTSLLEYFSA